MNPPRLAAKRLSKCFPGVQALSEVDFDLRPGEVHALVGENGAGKSTLMKILSGIEFPDKGHIEWEGRELRLRSPRHAAQLGIALIHQELNLADNLDACANIFLGRELQRGGWMRPERMEREAARLLDRVGADFEPSVLVRNLSIAQQQLVEIAKALLLDASVLIMDEPTSSLSRREVDRLFELVDGLRREGVAIVYISHHLHEVERLADRATVLRDGHKVGELPQGEVSADKMVPMMVGRQIEARHEHGPEPRLATKAPAEFALQIEDLVLEGFAETSGSEFEIGKGEIVGIAGLVGAGRTELLQAVFGVTPARKGRIRLNQNELQCRHPRDAVRAGIGLVPEDRKQQALFLEMALSTNISMASLWRRPHRYLLDSEAERREANRLGTELDLRAANLRQTANSLSGGNQQKLVLARWLALDLSLLLLDEPTRGIDVGARQEIYALLRRLADQGLAVLFASSEMEEILTLADRVLVMRAGAVAGNLRGGEIEEEGIMRLATGTQTNRSTAQPARG